MRYSTWFWLNVGGALVIFAILSALFLQLPSGLGLGLIVLFGLLLLVSLWLSVARMQRAMDDYGGTPMSGFWGAVGFDIEPDDDDSEDDDTEAGGSPSAGARSGLSPEDRLAQTPGSSPARAAAAPAEAPGSVCRSCGAFTEGSGSLYCRVCGAAL
jgi:hypothetical protein